MLSLVTWFTFFFILNAAVSAEEGEVQLQISSPMNIPGAKVASLIDARRLAALEYYKKTKSLDTMERIGDFSILEMGYDVPNFAKQGDKVWQAQVLKSHPRTNMYLGTIWIHSESGDVHFVAGYWDNLQRPQLKKDTPQGASDK